MAEIHKCSQRLIKGDYIYWCTRMKNHSGPHRCAQERGPIVEFKDSESYPIETRRRNPRDNDELSALIKGDSNG